jgi:hypothetical protein
MRLVFGPLIGAIAGFCARPCCAIPAVMSVAGVSSVAITQASMTYRPAFLALGTVMLVGSLWTTFQRGGGVFNKALAAAATLQGLCSRFESLEWCDD